MDTAVPTLGVRFFPFGRSKKPALAASFIVTNIHARKQPGALALGESGNDEKPRQGGKKIVGAFVLPSLRDLLGLGDPLTPC